jgi:hypothetical protein
MFRSRFMCIHMSCRTLFTVLFHLFVAACRRFVLNSIPSTFICSFTYNQSGELRPKHNKKKLRFIVVYFGTHNNKIQKIYKQTRVLLLFSKAATTKKPQCIYDLSMLCLRCAEISNLQTKSLINVLFGTRCIFKISSKITENPCDILCSL